MQQMFASVQQQFNVKAMEKDISLSLFDTDLHAIDVMQNGPWRHSEIL